MKYAEMILSGKGPAPPEQPKDSKPKPVSYADMILSGKPPQAPAPEKEAHWLKSMATGEGRTEFPDLPEFDLPFEFSARQAKTALGLMTTFDPQRELQVLKSNYPDLVFSEDKFGNLMADATAYGGGKGYVNKPGFSLRDAADIGFAVAAFSPAAKAGKLATTTGKRMGAVGATSAATQAGVDVANQATGGTESVSPANIDKGNVALAGGFGALGEWAGIVASKLLPQFRQTGEITDEIRNTFRQAANDAGLDATQVNDDLIRLYMDMAQDAVDPTNMPGLAQADEFGIRYTKGQITGNTKQLMREDALRHGAKGAGPQRIIRDFEETVQQPSIQQAGTRMQNQLGGPRIGQASEAGGRVREGIQARASALDDQVADAYSAVGDAYLSPDSLRSAFRSMLRVTRSVEFDKTLQQSKSIIGEIKDMNRLLEGLKGQVKPFHINRIEGIRRRLNNKVSAAENPVDRRQVLQLKQALDNFLDSAVDNALLQGDEAAIEALKNARGLRAEYARRYQRSDAYNNRSGRVFKDEAGDVMERLIAADPTDEQVINYVFGVNGIAGKVAGAKVAKTLKANLGADSAEWQTLRQAGFLRLADPKGNGQISGRQLLNRFNESMQKAPTLMRELYTPEELFTMKRFANAAIKAQEPPMNPSKTSYTLNRLASDGFETLMSTLGFAQGGPMGAMAGRAGAEGAEQARTLFANRAARQATSGVQRPLRRLNAAQFSAPAGVDYLGN